MTADVVNSWQDAYGNTWNITRSGTSGPVQGSYTYSTGGIVPPSVSAPITGTTYTFNWSVKPDAELLSQPGVLDTLLTRMITLYKPEDPLIICVDNDFTSQQINEIAEVMQANNIKGVIIPGARAGTGRPIYRPVKTGQERIDILARIGEIWEQHPEMNLTELLSWWDGSTSMSDDQFAAAVEVYLDKILEV